MENIPSQGNKKETAEIHFIPQTMEGLRSGKSNPERDQKRKRGGTKNGPSQGQWFCLCPGLYPRPGHMVTVSVTGNLGDRPRTLGDRPLAQGFGKPSFYLGVGKFCLVILTISSDLLYISRQFLPSVWIGLALTLTQAPGRALAESAC